MVEAQNIPPPNGFMRFLRRTVAVFAAISFFASIGLEAFGLLVNPVPIIVKAMLLGVGLMMFDVVDAAIKRILGGKGK